MHFNFNYKYANLKSEVIRKKILKKTEQIKNRNRRIEKEIRRIRKIRLNFKVKIRTKEKIDWEKKITVIINRIG